MVGPVLHTEAGKGRSSAGTKVSTCTSNECCAEQVGVPLVYNTRLAPGTAFEGWNTPSALMHGDSSHFPSAGATYNCTGGLLLQKGPAGTMAGCLGLSTEMSSVSG